MNYMYDTDGNPYTCFQKFAKGGSNYLDEKMLLQGIQELGYREFKMRDSQILFEILDTNQDKKVSYPEF